MIIFNAPFHHKFAQLGAQNHKQLDVFIN